MPAVLIPDGGGIDYSRGVPSHRVPLFNIRAENFFAANTHPLKGSEVRCVFTASTSILGTRPQRDDRAVAGSGVGPIVCRDSFLHALSPSSPSHPDRDLSRRTVSQGRLRGRSPWRDGRPNGNPVCRRFGASTRCRHRSNWIGSGGVRSTQSSQMSTARKSI